MTHSFNVELAVKYGIEASLIIGQIDYWCRKNKEKNINFYEGRYWTFNSMKDMSKDERASFGQVSNKVKQEITQSIEEKKEALEEAEMNAQLLEEDIDITLPSNALPLGSLHPLSVVKNDLEELFLGMGYQVAEGPEVESDHFNFELINLNFNCFSL